jgi:DNA-directed RNA polymerase subunit RPC12/RpoP
MSREWYYSYYKCPECDEEWEYGDVNASDDECPRCGLKAVTPYKVETL